MSYIRRVNLPIRKCAEQQAELTLSTKALRCIRKSLLAFLVLPAFLFLSLSCSPAKADIYRFITVDGVETFTDAPSDKRAALIMKDRPVPGAKKNGTAKKQKVHDISLDEIAQKAVTAALNPTETGNDSFTPHLPPVGGMITSKVGMRIDPIDGVWRQHNGIDIAIPTGTPVKAVAPGVVVYSGSRSGYGNTVIVEHYNGVITLYAHNSRILVSEGQAVSADSTLALSGSTGRSTGPHLHFEAWQSGTNITPAFLPDSGVILQKTALAGGGKRAQRFRSEVLSDGSVLFTNLPGSIP